MSILRGPGRRGQFPAQTAPESLVSDIFREIDEEVRRERLRKVWDQYSNVIIAMALLMGGIAAAQPAKPTDPQIAHVAYTAGSIDITPRLRNR